MNRLKRAAVAMAGVASVLGGTTAEAANDDTASKKLSICKNADESPKLGELDVVLLLDNSKSLNSTKTKNGKPVATDPDNERYRAISDLLASLASVAKGGEDQQSVRINFGMITFGTSAQERIPLAPLTNLNASDLAAEVKRKSPAKNQEPATNYVVALEEALSVLSSRPDNNCKFLVWFTDGQFEQNEVSGNGREADEKKRKQADYLRTRICREGGLADQFQTLRINTFVLVLKPKVEDVRLGASYGAMQSITGAITVPDEVGKKSSGDLCGNLDSRHRLGDVLVAEDAATIARLVPVVGNSAGGWTPATACPVSVEAADMPEMPAARHLARLSFTAYTEGRELTSLMNSRIVDSDGRERPFDDYLEEISSSRYERKYRFKSVATDKLNQGWSFAIDGGEVGWCVQMYHHRFEVVFTDDPSEPVNQFSKGGQLTSDDLGSLMYRDKNEESLTLVEARTSSEPVKAYLDIDPTKKLFSLPIPVTVKQRNIPLIGCETFELRDSTGRDMPTEKTISASCSVDTRASAVRDLSATMNVDPSLAGSKCNSEVVMNLAGSKEIHLPEQSTQTVEHPNNSLQVLNVVLKANGESAECISESLMSVLFKYDTEADGQRSLEVPIVININWKRTPDAWVVWFITALALALVALLNLFVLGQFTRRTSKLPESGRVMAYEVPVRLERGQAGQVRVSGANGEDLSRHQFTIDGLIRLTTNKSRSEAILAGGTQSVLRIKYPSLFRPFKPPYLALISKDMVYYWQTVTDGRGLSPMSRVGAIFHSPRQQADVTYATATLLVPSTGERGEIVRSLLSTRASTALAGVNLDRTWFTDDVQSRVEQGEVIPAVDSPATSDEPPAPGAPPIPPPPRGPGGPPRIGR